MGDTVHISSPLRPHKNITDQQLMAAGICLYRMDIYPTTDFMQFYQGAESAVYTTLIAIIFFIMAFVFLMFNRFIQVRNQKVVLTAARSNAIVSTIFPTNVRDRLFNDKATQMKSKHQVGSAAGLKDFLQNNNNRVGEDNDEMIMYETKPIADLFPEVSGMRLFLRTVYGSWYLSGCMFVIFYRRQ
jgi:hypothetical protein